MVWQGFSCCRRRCTLQPFVGEGTHFESVPFVAAYRAHAHALAVAPQECLRLLSLRFSCQQMRVSRFYSRSNSLALALSRQHLWFATRPSVAVPRAAARLCACLLTAASRVYICLAVLPAHVSPFPLCLGLQRLRLCDGGSLIPASNSTPAVPSARVDATPTTGSTPPPVSARLGEPMHKALLKGPLTGHDAALRQKASAYARRSRKGLRPGTAKCRDATKLRANEQASAYARCCRKGPQAGMTQRYNARVCGSVG